MKGSPARVASVSENEGQEAEHAQEEIAYRVTDDRGPDTPSHSYNKGHAQASDEDLRIQPDLKGMVQGEKQAVDHPRVLAKARKLRKHPGAWSNFSSVPPTSVGTRVPP